MPIKGISEVRRLPRLGKIRLGIKVQGDKKNPYPRAVDYFVVPEEIQPCVGEKPKKLSIMFPVEVNPATGKPLICRQDPKIVAVASDEVLEGLDIPQMDLNDIPAIADFIIDYCDLKSGTKHGAA